MKLFKVISILVILLISIASPINAASRGAKVYQNVDELVTSGVNTELSFDTIDTDPEGIFNPITSRFVIPTGVSKVILKAQVVWGYNCTGLRQLVIKKNYIAGDPTHPGWYPGVPASTILANCVTTSDHQVITPVLSVVPGDTFDLEGFHTAGVAIPARGSDGTWFSIEIIE